MNGQRRINDAINMLDKRKDDKPIRISGMLGTIINGVYVIHVPSRPGFVWVRLRNSSNEIIQAYSSLVSPIYDLPVIVERDPLDPTRYNIIGRDVGRYDSWGVANSPAYTNPVYVTTYYPDYYNGGVFVAATGTSIDFGENLSVTVTGSVIFVSAVDTSHVAVYDDATFKATGTAINFGSNLNVVVTGSMVFVSAIDTVNGSHVIVYEDSTFKATGTAISFGENMNVAVTGSTVFVSSVDTTGGGGSDLLIYDDASFKVTGTAINFGSNLEVSVTGSTAFVQAVGGGYSSEFPIYDSGTFKVTGTAIDFGSNLTVVVTGTTAFVAASGGAGNPGEGHITLMPYSYSDFFSLSGSWNILQQANAMFQSYFYNYATATGSWADYKVYLDAGTYTFLIYYIQLATAGIVDIDLDGVEIGSFDGYNGSTIYNLRYTVTGISVAAAGLKTIRLRQDGKNESSSGYSAAITYMALWRTA